MKIVGRIFLIVSLLVAGPALAWSKAGHMLSGAMAYQILKDEDPAKLAAILNILKEHPHYEDRWVQRLDRAWLSADDKDMYLFMLAARWPDDIRGDDDYHHESWHYINIPYIPTGRAAAIAPTPPKKENVVWAINKLTEEFAQDDVETRAVSLCWMFHLIGDVHQPLHAVALFSKTYPKGDRGGTLQYIRARANAKPMSLHQLWDGLVIGSERFSTVKRDATSLKNNPNFVRSKLAELGDRDPKVWAENESAPLARKYAYLNGKLKTSKEESDTNAPILQDEYLIEAKAIAERRMALAAYRLVDHLRSLPR